MDRAPIFKIPSGDETTARAPVPAGAAIITDLPDSRGSNVQRREFLSKLAALKPLLIIDAGGNAGGRPFFDTRFFRNELTAGSGGIEVPVATIGGESAGELYGSLPAGRTESFLSMNLGVTEEPWPLRNVVGVLPGSDPKLAETCLILSAHYDGTGPGRSAQTGQIWNGANDNASGAASVIEIAAALASLEEKPKRSIVFAAFFGEEGGLLGSRFYALHPVFPLDKTIAMVNLEQLGRTDSRDGDQTGRASLTGFDFSDMGVIFRRAGEMTGVTVYNDGKNSDLYFSGSDNLSLARLGVPAHTVCVAYQFADYHGAGDDWPKIDYDNMALTDRMVATGVLMLAQSGRIPLWNPSNPKAAPYLEAWRKLHPAGVGDGS